MTRVLRRVLAAALAALLWAQPALATSTVVPTVPAANSPLASAPIRNNFAAAANDINGIEGLFAGLSSPLSPLRGQSWLNTGPSTPTINIWDGFQWVAWATLSSSTHTFGLTNIQITNPQLIGTLTGGTLQPSTPLGVAYGGTGVSAAGVTAAHNIGAMALASNGADVPTPATFLSNVGALPVAGGTMTGPLVTAPSAAGGAGLNLPPGAAPTSPVNGDCWTTTLGLYCRINGSTVGPYTSGSGYALLAGPNTWGAGANDFTGSEVKVAAPTNPTDAVTKTYADAIAAGLSVRDSVQAATAAALPTNVYNNGSSGVGATLTGVSFGALTADGYSPSVGDRLLVKNEVAGANNGIYAVTATGGVSAVYVLTRTSDYNSPSTIFSGTYALALNGTANGDKSFVLTTTGTVTVGTTALSFTQINPGSSYSAGNGLSLTGGAFSINEGYGNNWTVAQTFAASGIQLLGSSTGYTTFASANAGASNYMITFPAVTDTVAVLGKPDQTLSGGANLTSYGYATGNITVDCGKNPSQYVVNGGAFTLTAPANDGQCMLLIRNNGSAGAVTFSGFTVGSNTGASLDTTSGHLFSIFVWRATDATGSVAGYNIFAHQ